MDPTDFRDSPSGFLVPTIGGAQAFVPNPLPPKLEMDLLVGILTEATGYLGELRGIGRTLPNPYLLIRPFQRREAVASSIIEGTFTSLSDLLMLEAGADEGERPPDTREVLNYVRALEHSLQRLDKLPVCIRLLNEAHNILLTGVRRHRGGAITPGEFKKEQNWIGGDSLDNARFVPCPPQEVWPAMDRLEKYVQPGTESEHPLLVRLALIHYQFETIHPYPDGNGRVGRLLIPLILAEAGAMPQPLLYLSPFFERRRSEYIDRLYEVSRSGAWYEWIYFFLVGVIEQCRDTVTRIERLQDLRTRYYGRLQQARVSAASLQLADHLFERPFITVPSAQRALCIKTYRGTKHVIDKLLQEEILAPFPAETRPKVFYAPEIFSIVDRDNYQGSH